MSNKENNNLKQALNELLTTKGLTDEINENIIESVPAEPCDIQELLTELSSFEETEEMGQTIIGKTVIVEGNVRTSTPLIVLGEVTGNITSTADLKIEGKVGGTIQGNNIQLSQCEVHDNITASNQVVLSQNAVINGNIKADAVISDGVINGNVDAQVVNLTGLSRTTGDVTCKNIRIGEGAAVKGKVETLE